MNKIKEQLKEALSKQTCFKHPVGVVIETLDPNNKYIIGWNGAPTRGNGHDKCLRKNYASGEGMEICPTVHAEIKAISHAAAKGISLEGGTIYMNEWLPCDNCAKSLIEAGLTKLVTPDELYQDKQNYTLINKLQNQSYNFEMAEKLIRRAGIEIIVDPSIKLD